MKYILPQLPYAYDSLEPYMDALTVEIHHGKHHQAYTNNFNNALADYPALQQIPVEQLIATIDELPVAARIAIRNNGGGYLNHSFFWTIMKKNGGGQPQGMVADIIKKFFGSFLAFQEQFSGAAKTLFGSGWVWLCVDKDGKLIICATQNQDSPLSQGLAPILCLDVWEHAYYLKYQNRRPDFITAWWHVVNWGQVEEYYRAAVE